MEGDYSRLIGRATPLTLPSGTAVGATACSASVLTAQRPLDSLAAIADFFDSFLDGRFRAASLPRLVARLILLPASHTRPVLFTTAAALLLCHRYLLCTKPTCGKGQKFLA